MTKKNDGGPAFPTGEKLGELQHISGGMTLRDYFADSAMQGIVSSIDSEENYRRVWCLAKEHGLKVSQWIARDAYKQADAMIVEREK